MQRVSSLLPTWERTRSIDGKAAGGGGGTFGRVFGWADKMATTSNRLSTGAGTVTSSTPMGKTGRETYWPGTLDKECEKAARILKSFCTDGFLSSEPTSATSIGSEPQSPTTTSAPFPPAKQTQMVKKIPPRIVQNAVGLAIFSCMRSGLWMSGSGGSGILIARKADGTWSPPSGIMLHTAGLAFTIGVDIYDCVLVINSVAALEMFTRPRVMLGSDVSLSVGPVASLGLLDNDAARWKELGSTVLTYLKARGQHRAVQLDGSMVTERGNENERFYGTSVQVLDVLSGAVAKSIPEIAPLFEAIKAAEGRTDFDLRIMQRLSQHPAPGDANIETPTVSPASPKSSTFGVPDSEDPDPFGVIALEMAGLEIREAGTRLRPTSTQFDYNPSPTSPAFNPHAIGLNSPFHRQSVDTYVSHSNSNRGSYMSSRTQATTMTDAFTQTDVGESARASPSPSRGGDLKCRSSTESHAIVLEPEEIDYTKVDMTVLESLNRHARHQSVDLGPASAPTAISVSSSGAADTSAAAACIPASSSEGHLPRQQGTELTKSTAEAASDNSVAAPSPQDSERDNDADDEDDEDEDEDGEDDDGHDEDEDEDDEEEPIIFEVATAAQPTRATIMTSQVTQVISAKGALVTIPKRAPPALPARNPARASRASKSDFGGDVSSLRSPVRPSFEASLSSPIRHSFESAASSFPQAVATDETTAKTAGGFDGAAAAEPLSPAGRIDDAAGKSYHHRATSSVYTTILQDGPTGKNPSEVPQGTAGISKPPADDDSASSMMTPGEPLTPKTFEDVQHRIGAPRSDARLETNNIKPADDDERQEDNVKIEPNHLNAATIQVA